MLRESKTSKFQLQRSDQGCPPPLPAACSSLYHGLEGRPGPRAQAKPREGAEESQERPPWQQAGAERQNPAHSPTSKTGGVGVKRSVRKRDSKGLQSTVIGCKFLNTSGSVGHF